MPKNDKKVFAILLAAGKSTRFKEDKTFYKIKNIPVAIKSFETLNSLNFIDGIIIVSSKDNKCKFKKFIAENSFSKTVELITGSDSRAESMINALDFISQNKIITDYIIIHEAGHEWFANNITYRDIADMWVHESFTTYSENLYLDYHYGKEAASEYVIGTRSSIANRSPIIGKYGVNKRGSDLYSKGANILHTLRQITANDEKWRSILRGLNKEFYR